MTRLFKILAIVSMIAASGFSLSACNTIEGIGEDAQAVGSAITGSARDNRSY